MVGGGVGYPAILNLKLHNRVKILREIDNTACTQIYSTKREGGGRKEKTAHERFYLLEVVG
jgi:hypothetical protein